MSALKWVRTYLYTREGIHGLFYEYLEMSKNVFGHEGRGFTGCFMSTLKWVRTYLDMREGIHGLFYEYLEMGKNTREAIHGLFSEYLEMGKNVFGHEGGDSRAVL